VGTTGVGVEVGAGGLGLAVGLGDGAPNVTPPSAVPRIVAELTTHATSGETAAMPAMRRSVGLSGDWYCSCQVAPPSVVFTMCVGPGPSDPAAAQTTEDDTARTAWKSARTPVSCRTTLPPRRLSSARLH
jgi:hypothetical protein